MADFPCSSQAIQAVQLASVATPLIQALENLIETIDSSQLSSQAGDGGEEEEGDTGHASTRLVARVLRSQALKAWTATNSQNSKSLQRMALRSLSTALDSPKCAHTLESVRYMLETAKTPENDIISARETSDLQSVLRQNLSARSMVLRAASLGLLIALTKETDNGLKLLRMCLQVETTEKTVRLV